MLNSQNLLQVHRQAYAEAGACGQRRTIVIRLGFVIKDVVDGGVETDASPDVVLEHQFPDGVALIDIGAA